MIRLPFLRVKPWKKLETKTLNKMIESDEELVFELNPTVLKNALQFSLVHNDVFTLGYLLSDYLLNSYYVCNTFNCA